MKGIVKRAIMCALCVVSVSAAASAENATVSIQTVPAATANAAADAASSWLEPAAGDWYDTKGSLAMTIQGNRINGCPVTAAENCTYDYPRTGTFTVAQANGSQTMTLDLLGHKSHQYLIVNKTQALRRAMYGDYNESIGGIYLGMTKEKLIEAYGQPTSIAEDQGMERLVYSSHHIDVSLEGNIVMAVRLYSDSTLKFDKSGLTARDSGEAYAQAYGLSAVPAVPQEAGALSPAYDLPMGEKLHMGQGFVEFSVL